MSTRSYIGKREGDNVRYIYCHSDGYPEGVGAVLYDHYADNESKIDKLLDEGDHSSLYENPIEGSYRSYGETINIDACTISIKEWNKMIHPMEGIDYFYLYEDGYWTCKNAFGKKFSIIT